mmetsp:Transcript_17869/g.67820  ORF Transcript_17869/g.67820 Transcript_17869/m.67820 type:complete len:228 (+) Transcript_17869:723-1406(+)
MPATDLHRPARGAMPQQPGRRHPPRCRSRPARGDASPGLLLPPSRRRGTPPRCHPQQHASWSRRRSGSPERAASRRTDCKSRPECSHAAHAPRTRSAALPAARSRLPGAILAGRPSRRWPLCRVLRRPPLLWNRTLAKRSHGLEARGPHEEPGPSRRRRCAGPPCARPCGAAPGCRARQIRPSWFGGPSPTPARHPSSSPREGIEARGRRSRRRRANAGASCSRSRA